MSIGVNTQLCRARSYIVLLIVPTEFIYSTLSWWSFPNSNRVDDDNGTASKYDLIKPNQHTNVPSMISYYFVINFCSVSSQSFALRMFVCPVMSLPSRLRSPVPERSFFSVPSVLSCFREIPDWRRCAPLCVFYGPLGFSRDALYCLLEDVTCWVTSAAYAP